MSFDFHLLLFHLNLLHTFFNHHLMVFFCQVVNNLMELEKRLVGNSFFDYFFNFLLLLLCYSVFLQNLFKLWSAHHLLENWILPVFVQGIGNHNCNNTVDSCINSSQLTQDVRDTVNCYLGYLIVWRDEENDFVWSLKITLVP